jgi:hypothetical protein
VCALELSARVAAWDGLLGRAAGWEAFFSLSSFSFLFFISFPFFLNSNLV